MDAVDPSPLRRFVVAKRSITSTFDQLLDFVKDGSAFVDEAWRSDDLGQVAVEEQSLEMQSCATILSTIREVLLRRHMKVAFFGRTSNGKSTVINAMLRDRVLPSGIGHTTNCFLSVEGTDGDEAYLTTEASNERRSVATVNQLAHALHMDPTLDSGSLVKVFWPKSRCAVLRDDLVLMDSPGTDVTLELDSWIDKFCLDADVFVLVGNAESTLMNTEKLFFHKVSERISKPNIFILHNRWDASVTEPEYIDQVASALADQIRSLPVLVEEFRADFSPTPETLLLYKTKLQQHVEERLVGCLAHRCSTSILRDIRDAQRHMIDGVRPLLSQTVQEQLFAPSTSFDLTYDLGLAALCADFQENIEFQFSLGWTALVTRFIGATNAKRALSGSDPRLQESSSIKDEMVVSIATGLVSVTSRASMTVLVVGGVVWRSVGWRLIALSLSLYGLLYLYEKLTWTNANRERALKQQFVEHAAQRLRAVVPVTSSACSQQVHKELMSTFIRLTQRVDLSEAELEGNVRQLSLRIQRLENIQRRSKAFRNRATELETQLEAFSVHYLQGN
uniref:Dynamin-type G domain-containing protein n=1 Tax=Mastacembelus armatus TaxID=205130 RepID=A0A3Q3MTP3_9TELE